MRKLREMESKIIVLTVESCSGCRELKKKAKGNVEICDINNNGRCAEIADKADIRYVPSAIMIEGTSLKKCDIEKRGDKFYVICDGEEIEV